MNKLVFRVLSLVLIISVIACKKETNKGIETNDVVKSLLYSKEEINAESKKANAFFKKYFDNNLEYYPQFKTRLGIKGDNDKWDDISSLAKERDLRNDKEALQYLNDSINADALSKDALLSYNLFKQKLENSIEDYKYRLYDYPVNQMYGLQSDAPAFLINMHQINDVKDANDYRSRLKNFRHLFDQLIRNLNEREENGIMPPKFVYDKVIQDSENVIKGQPFDNSDFKSPIWKDYLSKINKLDIDEKKNPKLRLFLKAHAENELLTRVKPAYEKLIKFLKEQKERATTDDGAWKFPNGEAFYNNALKRTTTTNLTADEIHEIGLNEVARIHKEMNAIKDKVGFKGSLQDFFKFMKTDKQFYYSADKKGRDAYIGKAVHIIDSMKTRLDELFITKPKADLIVKAVEPFREKSAGKAFYQRPANDGSRPGTYYANMYDMESMPSYQMEALAYHEGIPGHHMQLAIQQELEDVPMFRKFGSYTAYIEGWGLYSEFVPKEMGFYADPYSDFGRLAMELWRACRLVVDTGIHAKKWTREDGIKYYTDNTPNAELDAIKMVERHIVMPSQATAYKIGMLKILELRKKAKDALGDKFDIRDFHEVVLSNGAIPLNVLEDFVDDYITEKSK